jgi:hypothetical protein
MKRPGASLIIERCRERESSGNVRESFSLEGVRVSVVMTK